MGLVQDLPSFLSSGKPLRRALTPGVCRENPDPGPALAFICSCSLLLRLLPGKLPERTLSATYPGLPPLESHLQSRLPEVPPPQPSQTPLLPDPAHWLTMSSFSFLWALVTSKLHPRSLGMSVEMGKKKSQAGFFSGSLFLKMTSAVPLCSPN